MPTTGRALRSVLADLQGRPRPGELALVTGGPAEGRGSLASQIAEIAAYDDREIVHAVASGGVTQVSARYDEILRAWSGALGEGASRLAAQVERRRRVLAFDPTVPVSEALTGMLDAVRQWAEASPSLVVVEGLTSWPAPDVIASLCALGADRGFGLWLVGPDDEQSSDRPDAAVVLRLRTTGGSLEVVRQVEERQIPIGARLDPVTFLVVRGTGERVASGAARTGRIRAPDVLLYSGGARGSEACFGEIAARFGMRERHFTFEGHRQERTAGQYVLSPAELAAGDVSLAYVVRRTSREYAREDSIRRVLQVLWHMVSRSQQVFVVGAILDDDTVKGGTGWSVELARMWGKQLWVFDQGRAEWFVWNGGAWVSGEPAITTQFICGTGTRDLEPVGRQAIEALFARSFRTASGFDQ